MNDVLQTLPGRAITFVLHLYSIDRHVFLRVPGSNAVLLVPLIRLAHTAALAVRLHSNHLPYLAEDVGRSAFEKQKTLLQQQLPLPE
jgi:hypothetical protein